MFILPQNYWNKWNKLTICSTLKSQYNYKKLLELDMCYKYHKIDVFVCLEPCTYSFNRVSYIRLMSIRRIQIRLTWQVEFKV